MRTVIENFEGTLYDDPIRVSVVTHISHAVVEVSTLEDMLWRFGGDPERAEFRRLAAFAEICKGVASAVNAKLGVLGTESLHADELQLDGARSAGAHPLTNYSRN